MEGILKKHSEEEIISNKKIKNYESSVMELSEELGKVMAEKASLEESMKAVTEETNKIKKENNDMRETMKKNEDNYKKIQQSKINLNLNFKNE